MKKNIFGLMSVAFLFWIFSFFGYDSDNASYSSGLETDKAKAAMTANVTLNGTVLSYSGIVINTGSTISFGNMTPGTDYCNAISTVTSVTTNAANGYTIGLSDGSNTDSAMSGTLSHIPDVSAGTLAAPVAWASGTTKGLGVTVWTGTSALNGSWTVGTGTCATNLLYGSVPAASTVARTKTGYSAGADTTSWGWKVSVLNTQATGVYSGNVLFTLTEVL